MKIFRKLIHFGVVITSILLIVLVCLLAYDLASGAFQAEAAAGPHYGLWGGIVFVAAQLLGFDQTPISASQYLMIERLGNAIILLVSLSAIVFSSLVIRSKLAEVNDMMPYEKFDLWYAFVFRILPFLENWPKIYSKMEAWEERAYKNLSVRQMVRHYKNAERLLIVSGNYSWLFDTSWSAQARARILSMLPENVNLISYKTPAEVANYWKQFPQMDECKEIFAAMTFSDGDHAYNGSVVKLNDVASYIYLHRGGRRSVRQSSVCAFHGIREAQTLVKILEQEFDYCYRGQKETFESEKLAILGNPKYFS
ncbi:MAG TPA: hypothetical protein VN682_20475 [Terriglobales bacterium]|nr:hypothetical protein [Terriglobales bacterium]